MGFNTVILVLNDYLHTLKDSPKTVTFAVTNPPNSQREQDMLQGHRNQVSAQNNERPVFNELKVLPTFHADDVKYLVAGENNIKQLEVLKFGKTKDGKRTVTLILD